MKWSLSEENKELKPLCFSNGKSQEDVVNEILKEIEKGEKIIFVHGVCGTGKCLEKDSLVFCKPLNENAYSYYKIKELEGKRGKIISLDEKGELIESNFNNVRKTGTKKLFEKTKIPKSEISSLNPSFIKGFEFPKQEKDQMIKKIN
jgi:hypothetical protein